MLKKDGWHLSPIYDINPVPYGDTLALNIDNISNEISLELAVESAHYYCILKKDAVSIAADIINTIKNNWEKTALSNGLTHAAIENMRPAFNLVNKFKHAIPVGYSEYAILYPAFLLYIF